MEDNKSDNNSEEFEKRLQEAKVSELISYVSGYRALGLNRDKSILVMKELDRRRHGGDNTDYESEIENQSQILKSIGNGFVAITIEGVPIDPLIEKIRRHCYCIPFSRDKGYIHIGKASSDVIEKISKLPGIKEIISDKKVLENVVGSNVS